MQTAAEKANASASSQAILGDGDVLQLAIPIEVSRQGIRVVGEGEVIRAPRPEPGTGPQLRVSIEGGPNGEVLRQYELPDPRIKEVEGLGQQTTSKAQTFVYVDFAERASRIDVKPEFQDPTEVQDEHPEFLQSVRFATNARSTIQLWPVTTKVCAGEHESSPLCQQVIRRK